MNKGIIPYSLIFSLVFNQFISILGQDYPMLQLLIRLSDTTLEEEFSYSNEGGINPGSPIISELMRDYPSLKEKFEKYPNSQAFIQLNTFEVKNEPTSMDIISDVSKIFEAINRTLDYYEAHLELINDVDAGGGLYMLKNVLQKYGGTYEHIISRIKRITSQLMRQSMEQSQYDGLEMEIYDKESQIFTRVSNDDWKFLNIPKSLNLGKEKETVWAPLSSQCHANILTNCSVNQICQKIFLTVPKTQYSLTHQALYLFFAKQKSCHTKNPEYFKNIDDELRKIVVKMIGEAGLIASHGFPPWARDLFNEYVFNTGLAGYSNLVKEKWTQDEILSWQSKSEYGCFINPQQDYLFPPDTLIKRKKTHKEKYLKSVNNFTNEDEICYSHLTTTSLAALSLRLEWLMAHVM